MEQKEHLTLKWGTLKDWHFRGSKKQLALLKEYNKIGSSYSAMMQRDTPRQKEIICELIDEGTFRTICSDWDGKEMTKRQAKKYVMNYKLED